MPRSTGPESFSLGLVCGGLASEIFFSDDSGESYALPIHLEVVIENKPDLQSFVYNESRKRSSSVTIFSDLRDVVKDLESKKLQKSVIYTDIVGGTSPCYGETTMAAYNQNESLHPDSDLFVDYQMRYVAVVRPEVFFAEMIPPHANSATVDSHGKSIRRLKELGYHVPVVELFLWRPYTSC